MFQLESRVNCLKKYISVSYDLEYGSDTIEVHKEAFTKDDRVLIIDDVLATGGTARAAADLVNLSGAKIEVLLFLMELPYLNGRKLFDKENIEALIEFLGELHGQIFWHRWNSWRGW